MMINPTYNPLTQSPDREPQRGTTWKQLTRFRARALTGLARFDWLALLLARLAVGLLFLSTGWGKVHAIAKVTAFFESLHIPAPGFNAVLVGYSELICGAALVVGLGSRLATIPLIVSMTVALITAKAVDTHGLFDLVAQEEFTYLILLVVIAVIGPGRAALDALLARAVRNDVEPRPNTITSSDA